MTTNYYHKLQYMIMNRVYDKYSRGYRVLIITDCDQTSKLKLCPLCTGIKLLGRRVKLINN